MDYFLFSSWRCNNAHRCELSSANKQQATFEYVFNVVLGCSSLEKSHILSSKKFDTIKLCNVGFVYIYMLKGHWPIALK